MRSNQANRICSAQMVGWVVIAGWLTAWLAADAAAVGVRGGGGAMGRGGGVGGPGPGFGGGHAPSMGGFGGVRPPTMPRPSVPAGGRVAPAHGAIPGFSPPGGMAIRPGGGVTPGQLGNFLGVPGGLTPPSAGGTGVGRPSLDRLPSGRFDPQAGRTWPTGHAGNRSPWADTNPATGSAVASRVRDAVQPGGPHSQQIHNWLENNPQRAQQWQDHGDQIRQRWENTDHSPGTHGVIPGSDWWSRYHPDLKDRVPGDRGVIPGSDWWSKYHPNLDNWYYHHAWYRHGWAYWWGTPTWVAFGTWFPAWGWTQPVYYDYGDGGNVVYGDDGVSVNGQPVGTATQYAQSAADLATVAPEQAQQTPDDQDWLPLGTFAIVTSEQDTSPSRVVQLAVDHQGVISGTMHNSATGQTYLVQGRVDKDTQRVALTVGDKSQVVMETGIYNLTQEQTPVLVHFGTDRTEQYLLVRLPLPADDEQSKEDSPNRSKAADPFG